MMMMMMIIIIIIKIVIEGVTKKQNVRFTIYSVLCKLTKRSC